MAAGKLIKGRRMGRWVVSGLSCLLAACSSSSSSSGTTDAAVSDGGEPDGSGVAPSDAADATSQDGPAACNSLMNVGQPVTVMEVAQDPPAARGGTVSDGVYTLTSETIYTGTGGPTATMGTQTITIQITGGTIQVVKDFDPTTSTYSLATTGTTFMTTGACPTGVGPLQGSYTATSTSFIILLGPNVTDAGSHWLEESFTKQ
jgi:hypothetical protein